MNQFVLICTDSSSGDEDWGLPTRLLIIVLKMVKMLKMLKVRKKSVLKSCFALCAVMFVYVLLPCSPEKGLKAFL